MDDEDRATYDTDGKLYGAQQHDVVRVPRYVMVRVGSQPPGEVCPDRTCDTGEKTSCEEHVDRYPLSLW